MNALEDESLGVALNAQNAFHPEDILAEILQQFAHPLVEFLQIEVAFEGNADAAHRFIVMVIVFLVDFERVLAIAFFIVFVIVVAMPVVVVALRVVVLIVLVLLLVFVSVFLEEIGFVREYALEIEPLHIQHVIEIDLRILGAINPGHRVHAADSPLQRIEFSCRDEIGFVEQNDIGKSDLFLHLV